MKRRFEFCVVVAAAAVLMLMARCELRAQGALFTGPQGANLTPTYQLIKSTSLSNATEKLTVQQPSTPIATVVLQYAVINCLPTTSTDTCVVAFSQNGTAATGTALTPTPLNGSPAATATGWRSSNVGSGTALSSFTINSGISTYDLTSFYLGRGNGTAQNFSVACTIATAGTCAVTLQWQEPR